MKNTTHTLHIYDMLGTGPEEARTSSEIAALLHIPKRRVFQSIQEERREGKPIAATRSGNGGYYIAEYREDMETCCKEQSAEIKTLRKTWNACKTTARRLPSKN